MAYGVNKIAARPTARGVLTGLGLALLTVFAPVSVFANDEPKGEKQDRWGPAFTLGAGSAIGNQKASVESTSGLGLRDFSGTVVDEVRPAVDDEQLDVSPEVVFGVELMSPAITQIPGNPRFFANAEFLPTFAVTRNIAKEDDPTGFDTMNPNIPEQGIGGQGSRTTAEVQTLAWAAGIGVAMPFEWRGRQFRVKPQVGWYRYQVDVDGVVLRAAKPFNDGQPGRFIELEGADSKWFNAIGPGMELEMVLGRRGPIEPSVFIGGQAYKVLGNRKIEFSDSVTISDSVAGLPPTDTYTADWSFEVDPWVYRGWIGVRLRWLGN